MVEGKRIKYTFVDTSAGAQRRKDNRDMVEHNECATGQYPYIGKPRIPQLDKVTSQAILRANGEIV